MVITHSVGKIGNGYIVQVFPQNAAGLAGPPTEQYCADLNAVAAYLISIFVPGASYTPPPASTAPTA